MKNRKLWVFIAIVIAIIILNHIFGWSAWLGDSDNLAFLERMVQDNLPLAMLIYTVLTIVSCVVLALPGVTFAIIAGVVFGPVLGTLCCSVATTLGAMLAFLVGRYFLKDSIKPAAEKNRYLRKWLFDESGRNELFVLMITRLVPVFPYNLQNFAYGVTDISFATYSIGSLIFMLPGTAMYTVGFAGLADREHRWLYIGIAVLLAVFVFGMSAWLKKRYVPEANDESREEDAAEDSGAAARETDPSLDTSKCIHCGRCTEGCVFLSKYGIDISDGRLEELAYHCFLCGRCTAVCPAGIDGRGLVLSYRQSRAHEPEGAADIEKKYKGLLREKRDYSFRNYRHAGSGSSLFFPGCNFLSMYPKTTKRIEELLLDKSGTGTVYDCCGKPVAELGLVADEKRNIEEMNSRFAELGVDEIITACPNCYDYLRGRIDADVVSIYEKLSELGLGEKTAGGGSVFMPCPDRYKGELLSQIEDRFAGKPYTKADMMQCCGLGGSAGVCEPGLAKTVSSVPDKEKELYVYCATCAGKLTRDGYRNVRHVLPEILGTDEKPDTGKSYINRVISKFR